LASTKEQYWDLRLAAITAIKLISTPGARHRSDLSHTGVQVIGAHHSTASHSGGDSGRPGGKGHVGSQAVV